MSNDGGATYKPLKTKLDTSKNQVWSQTLKYVQFMGGSKVKDFSQLLADTEHGDLFDEENQQVLELAGNIQINNASDKIYSN